MLDKLKQLQQMKSQMDEVKQRLDNIQVRGEAEGVVVVSNGNRKIVDVQVPDSILTADGKDVVEDLVLMATNRALEQAEKVFESEMRSVAGGMMGGLGLF